MSLILKTIKMECQKHKDFALVGVCCTCSDVLVCSHCINDEHIGHVFRELDEVSKEKKQNLTTRVEITKERIYDLKADLEEVTNRGLQHNNMSNDVITKIQSRGKEIKDSVDVYTDHLVIYCEKQRQMFCKEIDETKVKIEEEIAKASLDVTKIEDAIESGLSPRIIITEQKREQECYKPSPIEKPIAKPFRFKDGQENLQDFRGIFGEIDMNPLSRKKSKNDNSSNLQTEKTQIYRLVETEVTSTFFQSSISYGICCLSPSPFCDNECWVRFERKKDIKLLDKDGIVKNTLTFDPILASIAHSTDKRTFVISPDDHNVKEILPNNTVKTVFTTEWMSPCAMCASPEGNLLISLVEKWSFKTTSFSKRILAKFTLRGFQKAAVEYDSNHQRLFMKPAKISANKQTGDVAVVNWVGFETGHLVVLDKHLRLKYRYFGEGQVCLGNKRYREYEYQNNTFMPQDVAFDSGNNIIVAELFSCSVQLLNKDGGLIKILLKDDVIPWSIGLQTNGEVWVGYDSGKITTFKYVM